VSAEDKHDWPWVETSATTQIIVGKSDWPKISIVTPSFNQGRYIEETIRSVLLQGYPNLEYIVIDGGSTDDTVSIIKKYSQWITRWVSEKDDGQADALNKGFSYATGSILGFLNSDDVLYPSALFKMMKKIETVNLSDPLLVCGKVLDFTQTPGEPKLVQAENNNFGSVKKWLDGGVSIHQPGCFWTKAAWHQFGSFRNSLNYMFDRYFFTRCNIGGCKFLAVDTVIAGFRIHPESKTSLQHLEADGFTQEWNSIKPELEAYLSYRQRLHLSFLRGLDENWRLVSDLKADSSDSFRRLLIRVVKNPLWIFHRPVPSSLLKWCAHSAKKVFKS
jgi:glycosyltransferase involved in cell wall biosynthesis